MVRVSIVLTPIRISTITVSILGARSAMDVFPFLDTRTKYRSLMVSPSFHCDLDSRRTDGLYLCQYASVLCVVPVVGMMCGNATVIFETRQDPAASRPEVCRPLAVETLRLALMPTIHQTSELGNRSSHSHFCYILQPSFRFSVSVNGITAILGMMTTPAILDPVDARPHVLRRSCGDAVQVAVSFVEQAWTLAMNCFKHLQQEDESIFGGSSGQVVIGAYPRRSAEVIGLG